MRACGMPTAPKVEDGGEARPPSVATGLSAGVLFAGFASLYLVTRQHNLSTYHDAIMHLRTVLIFDVGPHPHHLLYRWMERGWLWVMGTLDAPPMVAATSAAALSALSAASVVTVAFLLLRRHFALSGPCALLGASLVGFSYGPWLHATVINVYILPLALLLACLFMLAGNGARVGTYVAVGALHALAVLIHQAFVLFTPVVGIAAWMERQPLATRLRWFVVYALVSGGSVLLAYVLVAVFVVETKSLADFSYWITTYAHDGYAKIPGVSGLMKAAIGFTRAAFGALWIFAVPGATATIAKIFNRGVHDEAFLVRDMSPAYALVYLAVTVIGILLVLGLMLVTRHAAKEVWLRQRRAATLVMATFVVFAAFFLFWKPELLEFWMPQLTMSWLLWAAQVLRPGPGLQTRACVSALVAVTLIISNYGGGIRHLRSPANDYYLACVQGGASVIERGAPVFVKSEYLDDYLELFLGVTPRRLRLPDTDPYDRGALDPAQIGTTLAADAARLGSTVSAYVVGTSVPPSMLGGAGVPRALVTTPCEVWQVAYPGDASS